ncbi:MAG: c-type cytochrome [Planctomycetaceae bacterium]
MKRSFFALLFVCLITFTGLSSPKAASDEKPHEYSQAVEVQSSVTSADLEQLTDNTTEPDHPLLTISDQEFHAGLNPTWIWGEDNATNYTLQTTFSVDNVVAARLLASCDNEGTVFVNGKQVASGSEWERPMAADVTGQLKNGENVVTARVSNHGGIAAFVLKLALKNESGKVTHVVSNTDWTAQAAGSDSAVKVATRGDYGGGPWSTVFENDAADEQRVPQGVFELQPGFQVQRLFTVPKDELGSWVCIEFDNKGRLLASDQGEKGICRITLPPVSVDGGDVTSSQSATAVPITNAETRVERLDFSKCEFQPSGAHGMLWAFDSLYFCCNGGPGSGLYRARDTDGDDEFDECVKLKEFKGGGEHGPHSIRLSPDGKRIFVIAGNHTDPPFKPGEELENENYSSRIPTNWGEDLLLPRMWDANGHARGKLAPGGWIASTDPDGKTWEIWSIGYRNPYDMAFNADGELFAYDADMEWDVGTPWYRPTRVVHATSGSEFGWRSGTGKWPTYYLDSLPPLVEIGPGSPVGVDFGYGLKFPAKYQTALYICDWTFGTMYAIHLEPHQSSYRATKEEFVARSPLPLTDVAAGPDGALYFSVGGRGTQSELFRVVYSGNEETSPTETVNSEFADQREHRRQLESTHVIATAPTDRKPQDVYDYTKTVEDDVASGDRFLRTAARNAFYNSEVFRDVFNVQGLRDLLKGSDDEALVDSENPDLEIGTVLAMARGPLSWIPEVGDSEATQIEWRTEALRLAVRTLSALSLDDLSVEQQLDYLRAMSLVWIRLGQPDKATADRFVSRLDVMYPSDDWRLNRELCQMLVYLKSPTVVAKTIALMNQPPQREDINMGELLARNRGYGKAIKAMIDNQPDKQQMWYAFCLRVAEAGWTAELRADYYRWFGRAQTWSGGNSFQKFLQNIEDEAWEKTPFDHRVLVEKAGARTPYSVPELPRPTGPGKEWAIDEVRTLAADGLTNRNFENGQKTFAATRCIVCHRFAGNGGATGPDLTQLAGRFNIEALTEAILDPGKVISDQYKASTVVTTQGKTITGRIVSENDSQISVLTDPEDSSKVVDIAKSDIEETQPSPVSIMPAKLLNPLNREEVLDLLAYLLSRGDEKHAMFRKP